MKFKSIKSLIKSLSNVIKSSNKDHQLLNEAYKILGGALTYDELRKLSYIKEFLCLCTEERKILVKNIKNSRSHHAWLFRNHAHVNCFLVSLRIMLDHGISLLDFAKLNTHDQQAFITRKEFILTLTKNGIPFTKLCEVGSEGLIDMQLNLLVRHPFMLASLYQQDHSPKKIACISMIDRELDIIVANKRNKRSNYHA